MIDATPSPGQQTAPLFYSDWYSINGGGATEVAGTHFNLGMSVGQSVAGEVGGTHFGLGMGFWYGVGTEGTACPIEIDGDANEDGVTTAADIITMVNYVFKGGAPPEPCPAVMDVNCDGITSAADIIYMVNFVFKGGAPPCDICNDPGAKECVPNP